MGKVTKGTWFHAVEGKPYKELRGPIIELLFEELDRSYIKHGCPLWGRHEAWAIIKEELDEVWEEVRKDSGPRELLKELIQVAAVCIRYMETDKPTCDVVVEWYNGLIEEKDHKWEQSTL